MPSPIFDCLEIKEFFEINEGKLNPNFLNLLKIFILFELFFKLPIPKIKFFVIFFNFVIFFSLQITLYLPIFFLVSLSTKPTILKFLIPSITSIHDLACPPIQ